MYFSAALINTFTLFLEKKNHLRSENTWSHSVIARLQQTKTWLSGRYVGPTSDFICSLRQWRFSLTEATTSETTTKSIDALTINVPGDSSCTYGTWSGCWCNSLIRPGRKSCWSSFCRNPPASFFFFSFFLYQLQAKKNTHTLWVCVNCERIYEKKEKNSVLQLQDFAEEGTFIPPGQ